MTLSQCQHACVKNHCDTVAHQPPSQANEYLLVNIPVIQLHVEWLFQLWMFWLWTHLVSCCCWRQFFYYKYRCIVIFWAVKTKVYFLPMAWNPVDIIFPPCLLPEVCDRHIFQCDRCSDRKSIAFWVIYCNWLSDYYCTTVHVTLLFIIMSE